MAVLEPVLEPGIPPIPDAILNGLGEPGQRFAVDAWREFAGWTGAEQVLLRQAARALDDAETADVRGRRLAIRLFAALVAQLGLGQRN